MSNAIDMSTPVTRGELREELAQLETRIDGKLEQLETRIDGKLEQLETRIDGKLDQLETRIDGKLAQLETRIDGKLDQLETRIDGKLDQLETRIDGKLDQLETRIDGTLDQRIAPLATRIELETWGGALLATIEAGHQRMLKELAQLAKAHQEALSIQISVIDDKYADLPGRVKRLEGAVFKPKQR